MVQSKCMINLMGVHPYEWLLPLKTCGLNPYSDSEVGNLCCDYGDFKYMEEMSFPRVQKMTKTLAFTSING